ncbi:MAG: hypothetical protein ACYDH9_26250 [Limisphaerales bacterium]
MNLTDLAAALVAVGCPATKSAEMAAMLDKRARQLAGQKGRTYDDALAHLLRLMQQGWAAHEKTSPRPWKPTTDYGLRTADY